MWTIETQTKYLTKTHFSSKYNGRNANFASLCRKIVNFDKESRKTYFTKRLQKFNFVDFFIQNLILSKGRRNNTNFDKRLQKKHRFYKKIKRKRQILSKIERKMRFLSKYCKRTRILWKNVYKNLNFVKESQKKHNFCQGIAKRYAIFVRGKKKKPTWFSSDNYVQSCVNSVNVHKKKCEIRQSITT